jgi:hypothetical protein
MERGHPAKAFIKQERERYVRLLANVRMGNKVVRFESFPIIDKILDPDEVKWIEERISVMDRQLEA